MSLVILFSLLAGGAPAKASPCEGKKLCASVYVTPWCPYCKRDEPLFQRMLKANGAGNENAFQVVVGKGQHAGDNGAYAKKYGDGAVVDDDGHWSKTLGAHFFPTYYVQDASGKVLYRDGEAREWVMRHFEDVKN